MKALDVSVSGVSVGKLVQDRWEGHAFEPDPNWMSLGQLPVLSLYYRQQLGQQSGAARSTHLPAWFENLLPEKGSALRDLLCAQLTLREGQSFALLAALGKDLPGAVVVTRLEDDSREFDEPAAEANETNVLRFSSLAGNQLKFSMAKRENAFTLPAHGVDADWIVKVPSQGLPLLPQVEHTTMNWACAVGLPTPASRVVANSRCAWARIISSSRDP